MGNGKWACMAVRDNREKDMRRSDVRHETLICVAYSEDFIIGRLRGEALCADYKKMPRSVPFRSHVSRLIAGKIKMQKWGREF